VRKPLTLLLAILFVLPQGMANPLPDLGESSRQYLTDKQEKEIARTIMRDIYASPQFLADPEIETYLNELGQRLSAESTVSGRTFTFFAVRDPSINAFALPGSYIGVHTGLIQAAGNESELAGVLAHEIAHIGQEHLSRMIAQQDQSYLPTLAALAVAVLAARANANIGSAAIAATQALSIQSQLNFTRENESEADRIGFDILTQAGFDPRGLPSFFGTLQRNNRLFDNNAPDYLRTHPLNTQRIADMEDRVQRLPFKQVSDSREFHFVRARLAAMEGAADDAVRRFQDQIREKKSRLIAASQYGLALAYVRLNKLNEAERELTLALKAGDSPMLLNLRAELKTRQGNHKQALELYAAAIARYPQYKPLIYGYALGLILSGQPQEALDQLSPKTSLWPEDAQLWKLQARAHAALGHKLASHRAEAEAMAARGNLAAAMEQINMGLKAGDGSFYELSAAESRRRQWQEALNDEAANKQSKK
jgi:beta-barrel assembly-enhancing protease